MTKATRTNKAFLFFTLFFIAIAAFSFAVFQETEAICSEVKERNSVKASSNRSEIVWDVFSRGLIFLASYR